MRTALIFLLLISFPSLGFAVDEKGLEQALDTTILPFYTGQLEFGVFKGRDGLDISYAKLEVPDEKGALLISSGRTESHIKYAELIYDLRQAGFSIYILDHRGQGFSGRMLEDPQKGHVKNFEDYLDDFKTFVDTVVNTRDHTRRFILAHSMGGTIAALYAARHPAGIDALILCAPMMQINTKPLPGFAAAFLAGALTALGRGEAYVPGKGGYDPEKPFEGNDLTHSEARFAMNKTLISRNPRIALGGPTNRWLKEALKASGQAREEASEIEAPVLLFQAGMDSVVRPEGQDDFCQRAPDCTKISFAGANHEILMESDGVRDKALAQILEFLDRNAQTR